MKTARGLANVWLFSLAIVALGCHAAPEPSGTGTVRLQLVASAGGATYRLHGATFTVTSVATGARRRVQRVGRDLLPGLDL
jgi:hypothetical protein